MALFSITATLVNLYHVCQREMYLHAWHVRMEHTSDVVLEGRLIGENAYSARAARNRELAFSLPATSVRPEIYVKIDYYDSATRTVHETKKSNKAEGAHRAQLLFYLWALEQYGVEGVQGVLEYPRLRLTEKVTLSAADRVQIEQWLRDIPAILSADQCPPVLHKPVCRQCSYCDYCYAAEG